MPDFESVYRRVFRKDPSMRAEAEAKRDVVERILELREKKNVLILGHNYMHPLVYNLSHHTGDSLALSKLAAESDKPIILFDGVVFMAETAKILNPGKKVLIADKSAGCSLADPVKGKDVIGLKKKYPGVPVVTYVNSHADVKAESDICCTSANAIKVILSLNKDKVIFLPDSFMGQNLENELRDMGHDIDVIYPGKGNDMGFGKCEVHEKFTVEDLRNIRKESDIPKGHPKRAILAHWECRPEVIEEADFTGSTSQMEKFVMERKPERVFLATECEMAANLASQFPKTEFVRLCSIYCEHMRKITLDKILHALETEDENEHEVTLGRDVMRKALKPIQRMLDIPRS